MHPCSCVSVYVFVFLWACGRALHPYIFLTSGWTLMGHALHTAPSGCACMYVCVCVCVCVIFHLHTDKIPLVSLRTLSESQSSYLSPSAVL